MNIEETLHQERVLEKHMTLIEEPGYSYRGHVSTITSSAKDIIESIRNFAQNVIFIYYTVIIRR